MSDDDDEDRIAAGQRATSHLGFLANPFVPFLGFIVGVAGAFCLVIGLTKHEHELTLFGGFDVVSAGAACLLAWLVGRKATERAVARELDWIEDLPFPIENPFMLVGADHVTVAIAFRAGHPTVEQWAKMLEEASGSVLRFEHATQQGHVLELTSHGVVAMPGGHRIWRAWHDLIERTLVPLHARYAIESVRVRR